MVALWMGYWIGGGDVRKPGSDSLTPFRAQRQMMALEKVLEDGHRPITDLPIDVVAELVRHGLDTDDDGVVTPTPAAIHFAALVTHV